MVGPVHVAALAGQDRTEARQLLPGEGESHLAPSPQMPTLWLQNEILVSKNFNMSDRHELKAPKTEKAPHVIMAHSIISTRLNLMKFK